MPLVVLAAGTLLGGALFHMIPAAVEKLGNRLSIYVWVLVGFSLFFVLEQFLHWHHCHRPPSEHRPLTVLILVPDALHNFIGGLVAYAASFSFDTTFLLSFAAGNFIYIAAADLISEVKHEDSMARGGVHFVSFLIGLVLLLAVRFAFHDGS